MTFASPWALALLAAVPALLLLHRRRAPRVVRVASVAPFESSGAAPASERRGVDALLAASLAACTLLAFAAAGPSVATGADTLRLVIDRSPSMDARLASGTGTVGESAVAAARAAATAALPGARIEEREAASPDEIASLVAAARADGFGGVLLATDRAPVVGDPTIVVAGPGEAAGGNVSVSVTGGDGARVYVVVRNHGARDAIVALRATTGDPAEFRVAAGGRGVRDFPAPAAGAEWSVTASAPGDSLAADDTVTIVRAAARVAAVEPSSAPVEAALRALGWTLGAGDVRIDVGGTGDLPAIRVRAAGGAPKLAVAPGPDSADLGSLVRGVGEFPVPGPGVRLVTRGRLAVAPGARTLLADRSGVIAAAVEGECVCVLLPEPGVGGWARDASFVATLGWMLDEVAGPELRPAAAPFDERESDVAPTAVAAPSPEAVRSVRRPGDTTDLSAACAIGGALAAAAAVAFSLRRRA